MTTPQPPEFAEVISQWKSGVLSSQEAMMTIALRTPPTPAGYDVGDVTTASAEGFRAGVASVGEDARDAARYRQIRKGLSDRHGDLYAMVFAEEGDSPVTGDTLDKLADAAIAGGDS